VLTPKRPLATIDLGPVGGLRESIEAAQALLGGDRTRRVWRQADGRLAFGLARPGVDATDATTMPSRRIEQVAPAGSVRSSNSCVDPGGGESARCAGVTHEVSARQAPRATPRSTASIALPSPLHFGFGRPFFSVRNRTSTPIASRDAKFGSNLDLRQRGDQVIRSPADRQVSRAQCPVPQARWLRPPSSPGGTRSRKACLSRTHSIGRVPPAHI
jgi:hypothetical protein